MTAAGAAAGFAAFREAVLDSHPLTSHLRRYQDRGAFAAQVVAAGASRGFTFDEAAVLAASVGAASTGLAGHEGANVPAAGRLFGWTPFRAEPAGFGLTVDWGHLGDRRPIEPLFGETAAVAMRAPFNLAFGQRTPAEALAALPAGLPVGGFVFHMSRCGATLVSNLLAAFDCNIVVSEAQPLRAALRAARSAGVGPDRAAEWFSGLVKAYAQQRFSYEQRLFVRFAAADVLDIALVRRAFPDVPWLFLTRDPAEILASQHAATDPAFRPNGAAFDEFDPAPRALGDRDADGDRAALLADLGRAALDASGTGLIVDHAELPDALWTRIFPHFGMIPDAGAVAAMRALSRDHTRRPGTPFVPERDPNRAGAARFREVADAAVGPVMAALRGPGPEPAS